MISKIHNTISDNLINYGSSAINSKLYKTVICSTKVSGFKAVVYLTKWVLKYDKKSLKNSFYVSSKESYTSHKLSRLIPKGNYLIQLDKLTYALINISYNDEHNKRSLGDAEVDLTITAKIFGNNKNKFYNEALRTIYKSFLPKSNTISTFIDGNGYNIYHVPNKKIDSIFLKNKNDIFKYLSHWAKLKPIYDKAGILYKTGILLYGKPGTGKTSLIRAIATYYHKDILILSKKSLTGGNNMLTTLGTNLINTIIVLEDIDTLLSDDTQSDQNTSNSKEQSNQDNENFYINPITMDGWHVEAKSELTGNKIVLDDNYITELEKITGHPIRSNLPVKNDTYDRNPTTILGNLLNFLDGITSPTDVIFIATTNCIEKLDPALIRAGRFDLIFETKELDKNLAKQMCDYFKVSYDVLDKMTEPYNQSKLQELILKQLKTQK